MSRTPLSSRPSNPSDLSYIYDTWLNSWRISPYAGTVPNSLYFDTQRQTIAGLLARGASLRVVTLGAETNVVGWTCFEIKDGLTVLHYLYSSDPYLTPEISAHLVDTCLGPSGFITHQQGNKRFKAWKHLPEIARRKSL